MTNDERRQRSLSSSENEERNNDDDEECLEDWDMYRLDYEEEKKSCDATTSKTGMVTSSSTSSSTTTTTTTTTTEAVALAAGGEILKPGDHVYMECNFYQHHGIILETIIQAKNSKKELSSPSSSKVITNNDDDIDPSDDNDNNNQKHYEEQTTPSVLIAEFTNADLADEGNNTMFRSASIASGASTQGVTGGFRIVLEERPNIWNKVQYEANPIQCLSWRPGTCSASQPSDVNTILYRVKFLQECRHLIPNYHILASNCETVAVWAVTGKWETLQGNKAMQLSQLGAVASLAIPGFGPAVAAGGLAATFWHSQSIGSQWDETATKLNNQFEWYSLGKRPTKFHFEPTV